MKIIFGSSSNYLAGTKHYTMAYGTKVTSSDYVGLHLFIFDSGDMPKLCSRRSRKFDWKNV